MTRVDAALTDIFTDGVDDTYADQLAGYAMPTTLRSIAA